MSQSLLFSRLTTTGEKKKKGRVYFSERAGNKEKERNILRPPRPRFVPCPEPNQQPPGARTTLHPRGHAGRDINTTTPTAVATSMQKPSAPGLQPSGAAGTGARVPAPFTPPRGCTCPEVTEGSDGHGAAEAKPASPSGGGRGSLTEWAPRRLRSGGDTDGYTHTHTHPQ